MIYIRENCKYYKDEIIIFVDCENDTKEIFDNLILDNRLLSDIKNSWIFYKLNEVGDSKAKDLINYIFSNLAILGGDDIYFIDGRVDYGIIHQLKSKSYQYRESNSNIINDGIYVSKFRYDFHLMKFDEKLLSTTADLCHYLHNHILGI